MEDTPLPHVFSKIASFYFILFFYYSKVKNKTRNTKVLKDSRSLRRLHFTNMYIFLSFIPNQERKHTHP